MRERKEGKVQKGGGISGESRQWSQRLLDKEGQKEVLILRYSLDIKKFPVLLAGEDLIWFSKQSFQKGKNNLRGSQAPFFFFFSPEGVEIILAMRRRIAREREKALGKEEEECPGAMLEPGTALQAAKAGGPGKSWKRYCSGGLWKKRPGTRARA